MFAAEIDTCHQSTAFSISMILIRQIKAWLIIKRLSAQAMKTQGGTTAEQITRKDLVYIMATEVDQGNITVR